MRELKAGMGLLDETCTTWVQNLAHGKNTRGRHADTSVLIGADLDESSVLMLRCDHLST